MKTTSESEVGIGLGAFDRSHPAAHPPPRFLTNRRGEEDKSKLSCSHCGRKKHTRETCFHIHGYPEWWEEMKKSRQARANRGGGRASASAAMATGDRAAYAGNSASNFGAPVTGNNGAERSREEEKAVATVTAARVCGGGTEAAGLEVRRLGFGVKVKGGSYI